MSEKKDSTNRKSILDQDDMLANNRMSEKKHMIDKKEVYKRIKAAPCATGAKMQTQHGAACGLHCIRMKDIGVKVGKTTIIEHINLHIHCGKLTVIIGRNGAGKSTLIKAMIGEIKH